MRMRFLDRSSGDEYSGPSFFWNVFWDGNAGDLRIQDVGVEVRVVRPGHGAQFRMDGRLGEELWITERLEHTRELDQLRPRQRYPRCRHRT